MYRAWRHDLREAERVSAMRTPTTVRESCERGAELM
jgi:hypothetical protein